MGEPMAEELTMGQLVELATFCGLRVAYRREHDRSLDCVYVDGSMKSVHRFAPDRDANHARIVMKECERDGLIDRVTDALWVKWREVHANCIQTLDEAMNAFAAWLLTCPLIVQMQAVLKILDEREKGGG